MKLDNSKLKSKIKEITYITLFTIATLEGVWQITRYYTSPLILESSACTKIYVNSFDDIIIKQNLVDLEGKCFHDEYKSYIGDINGNLRKLELDSRRFIFSKKKAVNKEDKSYFEEEISKYRKEIEEKYNEIPFTFLWSNFYNALKNHN